MQRAPGLAVAVAMMAGCVASDQVAQRDGPPIPFEDAGACPFEGCVYREWVTNAPVPVRLDRLVSSPVVFTLSAGEKVAALSGVVVTTTPGRVEFGTATDVEATPGPIHVEPGQVLYLLTAQGEGFMKVWFNGRLYEDVDTAVFTTDGCAGGPRPCVGRVVEPWRFEWWIEIRDAAGRTGWTHEPEKFDNKDALG